MSKGTRWDRGGNTNKQGLSETTERLLASFNKLTNETHEAYLKAFTERKVDVFLLHDAVSELVATYNRLPSVHAVLQFMASKARRQQTVAEAEHDKEFYRQENKLKAVKEAAEKILGDDWKTSVDRYVKFWLTGIHGKDFLEQLAQWGLTMRLFEKPALFDLHAADFKPDKAVKIGRQRLKATLESKAVEPALGLTWFRDKSSSVDERVVPA